MEKIKEYIRRLSDSGGLRRLIIMAGAAGIALIFLSGMFSMNKPEETNDSGFSVTDFRQEQVRQGVNPAVLHLRI